MAKKQTRRSISVSRGTYERLKAFCETNSISMSQFVERRVGDYLGVATQGDRSSDVKVESGSEAASHVIDAKMMRAEHASTQTSNETHTAASEPSVAQTSEAPSQTSAPNLKFAYQAPVPNKVRYVDSGAPLAKDPDEKLSAEQIFTF